MPSTGNNEPEQKTWITASTTSDIKIESRTIEKDGVQLIQTPFEIDSETVKDTEFGRQYLSWYTIDKETITFDVNTQKARIVRSNSTVGNKNDLYSYVIVETITDKSNYDGIKEINFYFTNLQIDTKTQDAIYEFVKLYLGDLAQPLIYATDHDGRTYNGATIDASTMLPLSEIVKSECCNYFLIRELGLNSHGDYELKLSVGAIDSEVKYLEGRADSSYDDFAVKISDCVLTQFGDTDPFNVTTFADGYHKYANYGYVNTTVESMVLTTVLQGSTVTRHIDLRFIGNTHREYHARTHYVIGHTATGDNIDSIAITSETTTYVDPNNYDMKGSHKIAVSLLAGLFIDEKIFYLQFNDKMPGSSIMVTEMTLLDVAMEGTALIQRIDQQPNRSLITWKINDMDDAAPYVLRDPWAYYD